MTTIFITAEDPMYDYTPALKYGERLVGIFGAGQVHLAPRDAVLHARQVMKSMRAGDYLALSGDPIKIAICSAVAADYAFDAQQKVKFLRFNRQTKSYIPIEVDFS